MKKKEVNRQINEQVTKLISGFSYTALDTQTLVLHHRVAQGRGFYDLESKAFCCIDDKLGHREGKGLGRGRRDNQQAMREQDSGLPLSFLQRPFIWWPAGHPLALSQCP